MPAIDRLKPDIKLVSPVSDGNQEFYAKWIGDPITKSKKLGLFDSPKIKGTVVQDLDVKGDVYQFTIYFDDEDHDETAAVFWEALNATGSWTIEHPISGVIDTLYLTGSTWENQPVKNIGFTQFSTNWIQGLPDATTLSIAEREQVLKSDVFDAIDSAIDQFIDNISLDNFEQFNAVVSGVNKAVGTIKKNVKKFENLQIINPRLEALFRGIESTISSFPPDLSALAGQFVGVYEAVGLAQNSAFGAIDNMINLVSGDDITEDTGASGRNAAAVAEFNMTLANAEISRSALLGGIETRQQAIDAAVLIDQYFNDMVADLDAVQEIFQDTPIENQYVTLSGSFGDQLQANRRAIQYLLSSSLDLKIERRFTLKRPRSPLEIAWTELDGPGEIIEEDGLRIDQNFADFCRWNDLHGNDILILPAGEEVRVFV